MINFKLTERGFYIGIIIVTIVIMSVLLVYSYLIYKDISFLLNQIVDNKVNQESILINSKADIENNLSLTNPIHNIINKKPDSEKFYIDYENYCLANYGDKYYERYLLAKQLSKLEKINSEIEFHQMKPFYVVVGSLIGGITMYLLLRFS